MRNCLLILVTAAPKADLLTYFASGVRTKMYISLRRGYGYKVHTGGI